MNQIEAALEKLSSRNFIIRFYKYYIIDSILIAKREGFKSLLKQRGWKVFAVIVSYYTIRDTILYILIPLLIAHNIL
ncbi:MAG: hypothetical protein IPM56_11290 [Ignavibacteriales bacterium]|nr:MAG: hypothetical protein IPM56_11290 [Ignavibacteriales bacterium]